jgi:hypothetical protein
MYMFSSSNNDRCLSWTLSTNSAQPVGGEVYQNRIKTVSKPVPLILLGLFAERKQTPQIVESRRKRVEVMEPKKPGPPLHTQEVTGSSPVAPTINKIKHLSDGNSAKMRGVLSGIYRADSGTTLLSRPRVRP